MVAIRSNFRRVNRREGLATDDGLFPAVRSCPSLKAVLFRTLGLNAVRILNLNSFLTKMRHAFRLCLSRFSEVVNNLRTANPFFLRTCQEVLRAGETSSRYLSRLLAATRNCTRRIERFAWVSGKI